eukprot:3413183-Pyramimonas_sp.AAC.1
MTPAPFEEDGDNEETNERGAAETNLAANRRQEQETRNALFFFLALGIMRFGALVGRRVCPDISALGCTHGF